MAHGQSRLADIAQQLKENRQPRRVAVRKVLKWFDASRRGGKIVAEIEEALRLAGLATDPPFAQVGIDERLRFVLRSVNGQAPTGSLQASADVDAEEEPSNDTVVPCSALEAEVEGPPTIKANDGPTSSLPKDQSGSTQTEQQDYPVVGGQTTAQNEAVETVLKRLEEEEIFVPSYQRDSDEWDDTKKSLFIESVLNRLTVPAFYLAPATDAPDKFEVVDGQQRLTTLASFFSGHYRLLADDDCPYFGTSVQYAGLTYNEIHETWQKVFRRYNLTLVTLPQGMPLNLRLEVFRRINEGGTPLSGQDIRLSYYSESPTVRFIQLVGIYDKDRTGAERMLASSPTYDWPWAVDQNVAQAWKKWWNNTKTVTGQTPSEMFTWYIVAKVRTALDTVLANKNHLTKNLTMPFRNSTEEVLDILCAELKYEDQNPSAHRLLPDATVLAEEYFPEFETWWWAIRNKCSAQVQVSRYRALALLIPGLASHFDSPAKVSDSQWGLIGNFVSRSRVTADELGIAFPESKGRWSGEKGQRSQIDAYTKVATKIAAM
jgi:Protein of unknown function DUF262